MNQNEETNGEEEPISETLSWEKPDFVYIPKNHEFRQEGGYLICRSCPLEHATYIGIEKIMIGNNSEGLPIIKNRLDV